MAVSATYKIYDATANNNQGGWVEYYFRTSAALVGETNDADWRKFIRADTIRTHP